MHDVLYSTAEDPEEDALVRSPMLRKALHAGTVRISVHHGYDTPIWGVYVQDPKHGPLFAIVLRALPIEHVGAAFLAWAREAYGETGVTSVLVERRIDT